MASISKEFSAALRLLEAVRRWLIGRRLADGLTSRFVLHSLRASEGRLAEAQRVAHVGHWDRDLVAAG